MSEFIMEIQVGAYEAKTRLPELLRQVMAGQSFTITNRGQPVAELIPIRTAAPPDAKAAIQEFRAFMKANPLTGPVDIRALIEEGRE
jgi:prevent-host-death family protein